MNSLNIAGHVGQDAETRHSKQGTAITTFSIPVEQGYGEYKKTTWVRCTLFGKKDGTPHGLATYITKGRFIAATGEMVLEQWENKQGEKQSQVCMIVRDVTLGKGGEQGSTAQTQRDGIVPAKPAAAPDMGSFEDDIPF